MNTDPWYREPALTGLLRTWLRFDTSWYLRQYQPEEDDAQFAHFWAVPSSRYASADEIAAEIVNDPRCAKRWAS